MRILAVIALLVGLLILLGMSFLRINNLEYDVKTLAADVERLKSATAAPGVPAPTAVIPPDAGGTVPGPSSLPTIAPLPSPPTPAAASLPLEAAPRGFLDDGAEQQVVAVPARLARARVTIVTIEGDDGAPPRPLAEPISFTLQAGIPQEVQGICQGPETAAWVFVLEPAAVRITSRDCEYPVRGLRPRLRISAVP